MNTRIYVMTHKKFEEPTDEMYIPVHVGRALHPYNEEMSAYLGDDSGDNISVKNDLYSELTGLYWIWKNDCKSDVVGVCHYRRYLLNSSGLMFRENEIKLLLEQCDVITTKNLDLNFSYYYGFGENHRILYLDETIAVLKDCYPDYADIFVKLVHEKHTYFGNMMICKKEIYDAYMEFLFGVLFEVERRITPERIREMETDSYHRRIFGFISEFLLYVWIQKNELRVRECMVGMLGEKAETREVKNRLAEFFAEGDYEGAKCFFLESKEKRPDILMEASDVTGELHLCMQVIATAGLEQQTYGCNILDDMRDFHELMDYCNRLNAYHAQLNYGHVEPEIEAWIHMVNITAVAHQISEKMMSAGMTDTTRSCKKEESAVRIDLNRN